MWMRMKEAVEAGISEPTLAGRSRYGNVWTSGAGHSQRYWIDDLQRRKLKVGDVTAWRTIGPRPEGANPIATRRDDGTRVTEPPTPPPVPQPHRPTAEDPDTRYYSEVDPQTRRVICYAPPWKRPRTHSFDDDLVLFRAYSADGEGLQVRELATRLGWPIDVLRHTLKARGLTHASAPWPEWEMAERDDDDLVADANARRQQQIKAKLDRQRVADLETAERRQTQLAEWIRTLLPAIEAPPRPVRHTLRSERDPVYVVDAMTDVHVEGMAWDGTGHEERARVVADVTERMVLAVTRAYAPERVALIVGSDWLDADRYDGATTRGTPQRSTLPPEYAARFAVDVLRDRVQRWRTVAPVDLLVVPGNHDRLLTTWLQVWCETQWSGAPDVRVVSHPSGRVYIRHGACCIGVTHGDTAKGATLPGLMMEEADLSGIRHRHWITGHLHRYEVAERPGASVTVAPATAKSSPWALQNFGHGSPAAIALCYHATHGHVATLRQPCATQP